MLNGERKKFAVIPNIGAAIQERREFAAKVRAA